MSLHSLFAISLLALANAQSPTSTSLEPLASKKFTYPNLPYQVTGDQGGIRGPQAGYNICNSTTEGPQSLCQTAMVNSLKDFCMWSSPKQNDTIGVSEAYEVAWCTQKGHGARNIPSGAITGAQWLYAKNYLQVVGFLDQTQINLDPSDQGGGEYMRFADEYISKSLNATLLQNLTLTVPTSKETPSAVWCSPMVSVRMLRRSLRSYLATAAAAVLSHRSSNGSSGSCVTSRRSFSHFIADSFVGGGVFCMKMCNPDDPNAAQLCNHIYDEV